MPSLQWLAARAASRVSAAANWRDWLLADAGAGSDPCARFPAGPCLAALAVEAERAACWAVAQPVHLQTAIDHLRLAPPAGLGVSDAEARSLLETLIGHLAGTGFILVPAGGGRWLLRCERTVECASVEPAVATGRNLRDYLPTGRDAAALRSLINEVQMVLHEHPVNEARRRRGVAAVNSVWLWGFGPPVLSVSARLPRLATDDPWLAGLWHVHGARARPSTDAPALIDGSESGLVAIVDSGALESDVALQAVDSLLARVRAAVTDGRRRRVELHVGTTVIRLDGASRWRFWRRPPDLAAVLS